MVVEGFWRAFKHGPLASFSKPHLDFLTHIIITQIIPSITAKLDWMDIGGSVASKRVGRPKAMPPWLKEFKHIWDDYSASDELGLMNKELAMLKLTA
jgi:hypothetical protein